VRGQVQQKWGSVETVRWQPTESLGVCAWRGLGPMEPYVGGTCGQQLGCEGEPPVLFSGVHVVGREGGVGGVREVSRTEGQQHGGVAFQSPG